MDLFYYLYIILLFYIIKFFKEINRTLRYSSYTTLFKSHKKDEKSFILGIVHIIFSTAITPLIAGFSIFLKYRGLTKSIIKHLSRAGYYININTFDWYTIILKNNSEVISIANADLLNTIKSELFEFRIQSIVIIISALIVQAKIFSNTTVVLFEEGLLQNDQFYDWEQVVSINIVDTDEKKSDKSLWDRFFRKDFIHFDLEINEKISRYNFFKSGKDDAIKDNHEDTLENIRFKIPVSALLDFKCALRMVNIKSNIY